MANDFLGQINMTYDIYGQIYMTNDIHGQIYMTDDEMMKLLFNYTNSLIYLCL